MTLAIMQPYLFPYIGYFQLIYASENFVIYDDVNYIKQGWINRNKILINNKDHMFTLHLKGAGSFTAINRISTGDNKNKIYKTIEQAYRKAPYFNQAIEVVMDVFCNDESNLSRFVVHSIRSVCAYLGIKTRILVSSDIEKNNALSGEQKVIHICKQLNENTYINAIGGQGLYCKEHFFDTGIDLKFIKTLFIEYRQFSGKFIPSLSIIDVMMFNGKQQIQEYLTRYELI